MKLFGRLSHFKALIFGKQNKPLVSEPPSQSMGEFNAQLRAAIEGDKYAMTKILANGNNVSAQFDLGWMYYNGEGVSKDLALAASWFREAAEQGHAGAQYNLGYMYANGEGVYKDSALAVSWYRNAAEQGDADAQFNLGMKYLSGDGVSQDSVLAAGWLRKAAEQGLVPAQCNLGAIIEAGDGVLKDLVAAYMWRNLAAAQGDRSAVLGRNALEKIMTPAQIAEAQKLSREWTPKK